MLKSNDINFVKDQNSYKSLCYAWLPSPALNKHLKCLFRKANSLQIIFKAKWKAEKEKIIFHPFFIYVQIYCLITFYFVYPETKDRRTYNHKILLLYVAVLFLQSTKYLNILLLLQELRWIINKPLVPLFLARQPRIRKIGKNMLHV